MQGPWGWGPADPQSSAAATSHWQGQWESHDYVESSGWGADSWDQLDTGGNEEFANVMRWDDSGALDALETAQKLNEERLKGLACTVSLPSPDLYIQAIDWNSQEDLKLPDRGGTLSPPHGERKGQRKRGRRHGGGLRRQFDRQETSRMADWKQNKDPFPQTGYHTGMKTQREQEHFQNCGPLGTKMLQGTAQLPSELHLPSQDHSRGNSSAQWSSSYQKHNSNWYDYGRSHWDGQQNWKSHPSQHRWRPNISSEQGRGWVHDRGVPHWNSRGMSNDPHFQSTPSTCGTDWVPQHESNVQSFEHQPEFQYSNTGPRHQHPSTRQQRAAIYASNKNCGWRPQQQSNHSWQ